VRIGLTLGQTYWGVQGGIKFHALSYDLKQNDFVQEFQRKLNECWLAWTVGWGVLLKFSDLRLSYMG
jgi:hypothetical protein